MTQYLIIGAIVVWAVLYSMWSLMPAAWRRGAAARIASRAAAGLGTERARALEATLSRSGTCSDCAECKGCVRPPASSAQAPFSRHPLPSEPSTGAARDR
jgi:hypothetical protein